MSKPSGFDYGWVVVAAGALMTCVGFGTMLSLAVFLQPISKAMGWSTAGVSAAATLDFLCMGFAAFVWGTLSDRYGTRIVVLAGSILLGIGLVTASQAQELWQFQLCFGVLIGIAAGSFYAPMMAVVTAWFDKNRSLAVSLVSAGMGVAPLTVAPFARWLISTYDWRTAMMTVGLMAWALLIPAALLVRQAPEATPTGAAAKGVTDDSGAGWSVGRALRSPQFLVLALTFFACCAAHSGPIFHMVSYAMLCGIPAMTAVSIYSAEGLAGLGGRLLLGLLADRLGAKRVLIGGLLVQALAIGSYLYVSKLGEFYALAIVFGTAYGGVMPLYAVLAREYFGPRIMRTVFGAATMVSSVGMALGPWVGGMIFDTFHDYRWLYISALSVGLGAMAMAVAFPPLPSRSRERLQPA